MDGNLLEPAVAVDELLLFPRRRGVELDEFVDLLELAAKLAVQLVT